MRPTIPVWYGEQRNKVFPGAVVFQIFCLRSQSNSRKPKH